MIQDAQGKPCVVINSRDITERKLAEAGLRESNERFTGAFDHAAIGMGIVTTEGRWIAVNSALCKIVGYSEQELRATTFQAITHPDDLDRDLAYVRQMLAGEIQTYQMEKRYIHKQGAVVWILLNVSLVRDAQGAPMYFVAQIQDITERKQAEQAQTWLASIVESSNDAIFSRDLDGTILTWNLGAEIMFGYTAEEMIGQPITALVPPDRLGEESHFLDRIREGHRIDYFETVRQRKDGHSVHVSVSLSPISDRKGHLVAISQITRNITEQMDVQRALHQAFEEREQLSLDLHDNIIQIVYATGLALEDCVYRLSDRAGPSAQILGQAIDNLNCVIQDLRGFIHGDQRELIEPLQFESELDRLAQTMSLRNILAWDLRVAPSAIARLTALEATQLLFIAREAISNTMQHSQGRTVTIALVTTAEGVLLTVEDDGIGFETIIKPGHGLRNMATRAHKLGAQYKIISSPGQGTKILVQLLKENAYGIE
ncbi:MAG: PAS domain S-box protein [Nitrospiraceae bacterium]